MASRRDKPKYVSTRGFKGSDGDGINFESAVLTGLAPDGGLFVPTFFPCVDPDILSSWRQLSFCELALCIFSMYIPEEEVSYDELRNIIERSYATFRSDEVTPVVDVGEGKKGVKVLELFHGPTFAFKDVALQFLGNLFEHFLQKRNKSITVVGATSGDTGSSAIYGLRGKENVNVFILFPEGRVSPIQERQMTTVLDDNIHCIAVEGTFDDAQAIVKALFNDSEVRNELNLAAVNSINWARILAQIVYYFYAYFRVVDEGSESKVSFSVPTGNFGDILAGYYAKRMGLPVDLLVPATNENDIVCQFFQRGVYQKPPKVIPTQAPSMDICVSSNFERFLFHVLNDSSEQLANLMRCFEHTGEIKIDDDLLKEVQKIMISERLCESEIRETIRKKFVEDAYLLDPHSAIGVGVAEKLSSELQASPVVCLACAHWGKFSDAVSTAIGLENFGKQIFPSQLEELKTLVTRKSVLPANKAEVLQFMKVTIGK